MGKTIAQYAAEYTLNNIVFVSGQYEIRINRGADGTISAKHNFGLSNWTNIPDAYEIEAATHFSEHGRISAVTVRDINGNVFIVMDNFPHVVNF